MRLHLLAAILLACVTNSALGCDAGPLEREVHFSGALYVAVGQVEAERYLSDQEVSELPGSGAEFGARPREVQVGWLEAVVGEAPAISKVLVLCGAKFPVVGERVVYGQAQSGFSWVYPANYGEPVIREFIAGES